MLVYVRPSNEALPRARVPGAQDQRGCHSIPLPCAFREQEGHLATYLLHSKLAGYLSGMGAD
jgi:hypothetical protein